MLAGRAAADGGGADVGVEVKGARRWLSLARRLDPAVGVPQAGLRRRLRLALRRARAAPDIPGNLLGHGPARRCRRACWCSQPDLGQTILISSVLGRACSSWPGMPWLWIDRAGRRRRSAALSAPTHASPHVAGAHRPLPDTARATPSRSTRRAKRCIKGGWLGLGPGEGTVKRDPARRHTDFIFAVAGEEFGIVLCFVHHGAVRLHRAARRCITALKERGRLHALAVTGLVVLFGIQAIDQHGRQPAA